MSVNKFGRYSATKSKVAAVTAAARGPKGKGFNLTPEGNYDVLGKRLKNVFKPLHDSDAVNYATHVQAF